MKITLKHVLLRYAGGLFVPSKYTGPGAKPDDKVKFSAKFYIDRDSENMRTMAAAIHADAKREFGAAAEETLKAIKALGMIWCLVDGDTKEDKHAKGKLVVTAKNSLKPLLVDDVLDPETGKARVLTGTAAEERLYSGCYVNAILDVKVSSKPQKQSYAYLLGVQYAGIGDRLGGMVAAADDFEAIPGTEEAKGETVPAEGAGSLF